MVVMLEGIVTLELVDLREPTRVMLVTPLDFTIIIDGQYTWGDKGTTTVILEAVATHNLWI